MRDIRKNESKAAAYEYKTVTVRRDMEEVWRDAFEQFGWRLEKSQPAIVKHVWGPVRVMMAPLALLPGTPCGKLIRDHESETRVELKFKRDRLLSGNEELSRLEAQFEAYAREVDHLEASKGSRAMATACLAGVVGTVFMGASVFGYLDGFLARSIVLAVPGFAGWILSAFIHKAMKRNQTQKVDSLIEQRYDRIYEVCGKANALFHTWAN